MAVVRDWKYIDLHKWVRRTKGSPTTCEECGKVSEHIDWANISGKYLKDPKDYRALCRSCHRMYDFIPKPKCGNGHEYTPENTAWRTRPDRKRASRVCITCRNNDNKRRVYGKPR